MKTVFFSEKMLGYLKSLLLLYVGMITAPLVGQENTVRIDTVRIGKFDTPKSESLPLEATMDSFLIDPDWQYDPVLANSVAFRYRYQAVYPNVLFAEQATIRKGEFQVSGLIGSFGNGALYGSGRQENLLGLGQLNSAGLTYEQALNDRLSIEYQLYTQKFSAPYQFSQMVGSAARINYQLSDKLALHILGGYSVVVQNGYANYNFGATFSYDITDRWGVELGANRYYDNFSNRWETVPVAIPYYRINKDTKIGIDFGPVVKDLIIQKRNSNRMNPTIPPPFP